MTIDVAQWLAWKRDLVGVTDLDRDALHIYACVAIQAGTAALTRRKLGDWLPWFAVLAVALVVEAADIYGEVWHSLVLQVGKSVHDVFNSMVLPTFLMVLSRRWPALIGRT